MMMIRETFPIMRVNILATKKKTSKIEKYREKAKESELPNQRNSQTFNQEKKSHDFLDQNNQPTNKELSPKLVSVFLNFGVTTSLIL